MENESTKEEEYDEDDDKDVCSDESEEEDIDEEGGECDEAEKYVIDNEEDKEDPKNQSSQIQNISSFNLDNRNCDNEVPVDNMAAMNINTNSLLTNEMGNSFNSPPTENDPFANVGNTNAAEIETGTGSDLSRESVPTDCAVHLVIENRPEIVSSEELLDIFRKLANQSASAEKREVRTVGMVGYPNVGKSSTINAILQQKKLAVSATPGRTKHLQVKLKDR